MMHRRRTPGNSRTQTRVWWAWMTVAASICLLAMAAPAASAGPSMPSALGVAAGSASTLPRLASIDIYRPPKAMAKEIWAVAVARVSFAGVVDPDVVADSLAGVERVRAVLTIGGGGHSVKVHDTSILTATDIQSGAAYFYFAIPRAKIKEFEQGTTVAWYVGAGVVGEELMPVKGVKSRQGDSVSVRPAPRFFAPPGYRPVVQCQIPGRGCFIGSFERVAPYEPMVLRGHMEHTNPAGERRRTDGWMCVRFGGPGHAGPTVTRFTLSTSMWGNGPNGEGWIPLRGDRDQDHWVRAESTSNMVVNAEDFSGPGRAINHRGAWEPLPSRDVTMAGSFWITQSPGEGPVGRAQAGYTGEMVGDILSSVTLTSPGGGRC